MCILLRLKTKGQHNEKTEAEQQNQSQQAHVRVTKHLEEEKKQPNLGKTAYSKTEPTGSGLWSYKN